MRKVTVSDEEYIELIETKGISQTANHLGLHDRTVQRKRVNLEKKYRRKIRIPGRANTRHGEDIPGSLKLEITDGVVLIGSDAHYWPNYRTTAHAAFVRFCKTLKPKIVCMNGDMIDGATVSRWPQGINRDHLPSVQQEILVTQERLDEIRLASKNASLVWTTGNHDLRVEARLGATAAEFAGVMGFSLKDHFPHWWPTWTLFINDSETGPELEVTHRFRNGIHADRNNVLWNGRSIATGHLHRLRVSPHSDRTGTRFGIETGCMADIYGPQFEYAESNARSWQSGFVVCTFKDGKLLHPEIVRVASDGVVEFRGEHINVGD